MDARAAERVIEAARWRGVFLMEGYMYRCHPLMRQLASRLQEGIIGAIRHVRADFAFRVPRDPEGRLFAPRLGGGGILDVGGYVVSFARLIAGLAQGTRFAEPIKVDGNGVIGPHGADETATALLTFQSGLTATVTAAVFHDAGTAATIFGDEGKIELPNPWIPRGQRQGLETSYVVHRDGRAPETVIVRTDQPTYAIEAELVADTLPATEAPWPAMSWAETLGTMRVLDAWQAALRRR
jgi:predicted dehydrogenase